MMSKEKRKVTVLYPGGFKPLTGAHIQMIDKYLKHPDVDRLVLFISPGKRDVVSALDAYRIIEGVLKDRNIEIVLDKNSYSPILAVYRWIEHPDRNPGKYALASSSKGDDYKRVKEFTRNYEMDKFGKNLPEGVKVVELPVDTEPLLYPNGDPISATRARKDLKNKDYKSFKENYPGLGDNHIGFIWKHLIQKSWEEQQVT